MRKANGLLAALLAGAMALAFVAMPQVAGAQQRQAERERTHRVTSSVLGAAGLYMLSRKQTTLGAIALAGSAYEAKRMQDEINKRHRRQRLNSYYRGYRSGRQYAYSHPRTRTGRSYRTASHRSSSRRGRTWASTRGRKVGWHKNGKAARYCRR